MSKASNLASRLWHERFDTAKAAERAYIKIEQMLSQFGQLMRGSDASLMAAARRSQSGHLRRSNNRPLDLIDDPAYQRLIRITEPVELYDDGDNILTFNFQYDVRNFFFDKMAKRTMNESQYKLLLSGSPSEIAEYYRTNAPSDKSHWMRHP